MNPLDEQKQAMEDVKSETSTKKRFWWLKLRDTFFNDAKVKKLRRLPGGDVLTIIYLKMMLVSVRNEGILIYEALEDTFVEELSLRLDESPEDIQNALDYLKRHRLIETDNDVEYMLREAMENIGSETDAAERMRNMRKRRAAVLPEVAKA